MGHVKLEMLFFPSQALPYNNAQHPCTAPPPPTTYTVSSQHPSIPNNSSSNCQGGVRCENAGNHLHTLSDPIRTLCMPLPACKHQTFFILIKALIRKMKILSSLNISVTRRFGPTGWWKCGNSAPIEGRGDSEIWEQSR